jgi:hypothetical protein
MSRKAGVIGHDPNHKDGPFSIGTRLVPMIERFAARAVLGIMILKYNDG